MNLTDFQLPRLDIRNMQVFKIILLFFKYTYKGCEKLLEVTSRKSGLKTEFINLKKLKS